MKRYMKIMFLYISTVLLQSLQGRNLADIVKHIKETPKINNLINSIDNLTLPHDISCLVIDLKYREDALKILELGELNRSYVSGHDKLYGAGTVWKNMWHELACYKKPIWYLQRPILSTKETDKFGYDEFTAVGARLVNELKDIEKDQEFIKQTSKQKQDAAIIVMRPLKDEISSQVKFKEKYQNVLFLNNATSLFATNKYLFNLLMDDSILNNYIPTTKVYKKKYSPELTNNIIDTFGKTMFVIKPLNSANGWGVIICDHQNLDKNLKKILQDPQKLKDEPDKVISYWADDKNTSFIIQRYEPSLPLIHNNKAYDATMRVIVLMSHINKKFRISFLGSYWKMPSLAIDESGTLTEKYKSNVHQKNNQASAKLNDHDEQIVYTKLRDVMQLMYVRMLYIKGKLLESNNKDDFALPDSSNT